MAAFIDLFRFEERPPRALDIGFWFVLLLLVLLALFLLSEHRTAFLPRRRTPTHRSDPTSVGLCTATDTNTFCFW